VARALLQRSAGRFAGLEGFRQASEQMAVAVLVTHRFALTFSFTPKKVKSFPVRLLEKIQMMWY